MITRLNYFSAKAGRAVALREALSAAVPEIEQCAGSVSCRVLQSDKRPEKFVVVELWDDIEAHQSAVQAIPREKFAAIMPLLEAPPAGEYFRPVQLDF